MTSGTPLGAGRRVRRSPLEPTPREGGRHVRDPSWLALTSGDLKARSAGQTLRSGLWCDIRLSGPAREDAPGGIRTRASRLRTERPGGRVLSPIGGSPYRGSPPDRRHPPEGRFSGTLLPCPSL